jgi:hypothetical protein
MKLKKVASVCGRAKRIIIYNKVTEEGELREQWIGDGAAAYKLEGLPELDTNTAMTVFDVPPDKREKWYAESTETPDSMSFSDVDDSDEIVSDRKLTVIHNGHELLPCITKSGLTLIKTEYLQPLSDVFNSMELYVRTNCDGERAVVAKTGMYIQAVIMRFTVTKSLTDEIGNLYRGCIDELESAGVQTHDTE